MVPAEFPHDDCGLSVALRWSRPAARRSRARSPRTARSPSSTSSARPRSRRRPSASSAPASPSRTTCSRSASSRSRSPTGSAASRSAYGHGHSPNWAARSPSCSTSNDGIQVDQIAALKPDLIVATNAGLDQDTYTKLSAIAPTIAQSGPDAFFEPWKDQATAIGQAVFKADDMAKLIAGVDEKFADVGQEQPPVRRQEGAAARRDLLSRTAFGSPRPAGAPTSSPTWASPFPTPAAGWCRATRWRRSSTTPTC